MENRAGGLLPGEILEIARDEYSGGLWVSRPDEGEDPRARLSPGESGRTFIFYGLGSGPALGAVPELVPGAPPPGVPGAPESNSDGVDLTGRRT